MFFLRVSVKKRRKVCVNVRVRRHVYIGTALGRPKQLSIDHWAKILLHVAFHIVTTV